MKKKLKLNSFFLWGIATSVLYFLHNFIASISSVVLNNGVSFGINGGLVYLSYVLFFVILIWSYSQNKLYLWFLLAGGFANLIDRIRFGEVRDYWQIFNTSIYNNINDWVIFLSIIILVLTYGRRNKNSI